VVEFTFALNHQFGGGLWGYHAFNLAVHLFAALTLFGIVRRTMTLPVLAPRYGARSGALAFCIALLWMLHPLQTESVTYIVQRMESLMGLFYLLTLYCFIRAASLPDLDGLNHQDTKLARPPRGGTSRAATNSSVPGVWVSWWSKRWYAAAVLACALGMGCKEVMITAPVLVLLYDRTFIAGSFRDALRRRWGFYLGLAVTLAIVAPRVAAAFAPHAISAGFGLPGIRPLDYAASEPGVIVHYLALAFWPSGLCLDYGWPVAKSASGILPGAIILAGLLAVTAWALLRRPACRGPAAGRSWGFLGAWFFLVLAPTSSFMPIRDLASEHRMYLPLAAVVAASVVAAYRAGGQMVRRLAPATGAQRRLGGGLAAGFVLSAAAILGALTFARNTDYRTETSVWDDAVLKQPENARAWTYRAGAYAAAGRRDKALECFDRAFKLRPAYPEAYYNRAGVYRDLNRFEDAIRDYDHAIALDPYFAAAFNNRGSVYAAIGQDARALSDYDRALKVNPDFVMAHCNRATAYDNQGEYDLAIGDCESALALDPDSSDAYNSRAFAYLQLRQYTLALRDYDRCIELKPDYAEAHSNRAVVEAHLDRYDLALRDCNRAIELKPDYLDAYKNRVLIYYRIKEYRKALADVKIFQKLGGRLEPDVLKELREAAGRSE